MELESLKDLLRAVYNDIPQNALTLQDRNTLNLPERAAATPTPILSTRPVGKVDTSMRLQHTIAFTDEATPTRRGKPNRVRGCQIWSFIGTATPADPKEFHYLATDTASPYVAHYEGADTGKSAYYILR